MKQGGFRISRGDGVVLLLGVLATVAGWNALGELRPLPAVVLVHFLLFCNVVRVRRAFELLWAATFVLNVLAWQAAGRVSWAGVPLVQAPVTIAVVSAQVVSGWYHGVGYSRLPARFGEKWRRHREQLEQQDEEQVPPHRASASATRWRRGGGQWPR